jgi:hypothetical protein
LQLYLIPRKWEASVEIMFENHAIPSDCYSKPIRQMLMFFKKYAMTTEGRIHRKPHQPHYRTLYIGSLTMPSFWSA